ncbi:MAG: hypothetical protein IJU36_03575 [Paludibacteraceae bacterium]|nr:hypothetical protein [Paludibacteraceae bacterium]
MKTSDKEMNKSKIFTWIDEFAKNSLSIDSYHIDELFGEYNMIKKKDWFTKAFDLFTLCYQYSQVLNNSIGVFLCYELNITTNKCPIPKIINSRCFVHTDTPPEIFIFKEGYLKEEPFKDWQYVPHLSNLYEIPVYLFERKEDVYWRWIFMTRSIIMTSNS